MLAIFAFLYAPGPVAPPVEPTAQQYQPSVTYPRFPQPVLACPGMGHWYLQVSNAGVLQVGGRTLDAPTSVRNLQLVDQAGLAAYRFVLTPDTVPVIGVYQLRGADLGYFQDVPIWSPNGREWTLQITAIGEITVGGKSSDWLMTPNLGIPTNTPLSQYQQPVAALSGGHSSWKLLVSDSGIWNVTQDWNRVQTVSSTFLWTQDDTRPFQLVVNEDGLLTVIDASPFEPRIYETILVSPGGTFFTLEGDQVDGDIILSVRSTLFDAMNQRDEWPLVISQHGNYLYIADNRFPPPLPLVSRRWGQRRRSARRHS